MKYVFTLLGCFIYITSFAQIMEDPRDTVSFQAVTYLKKVDSSGLPEAEKNRLRFEKIKQYITKRPNDGFFGQQFLWYSKDLDSTRIDFLISLFDTAVQREYAPALVPIKTRSRLMTGRSFPEMTLIDTSKNFVRVADLKGKVILIDFWASWCQPCRAEMPALISLYERYKDKGFIVIAISLDEQKENWLKAIREDSLPWIHYCDLVSIENNDLGKRWGFLSIPYNFLIDRNGILINKEVSMDELERELVKLL